MDGFPSIMSGMFMLTSLICGKMGQDNGYKILEKLNNYIISCK